MLHIAMTPEATDRDPTRSDGFLGGGGEAGALVRGIDWADTPLGPVESWSQALRSTTALVLHNHSAMLLWWGPEFVQIYNDAYRPVLGDKHPCAMGQRFRDCWTEVFHILGPMAEQPFHGGPASTRDDIPLFLDRKVPHEETHFRIAYSPVPDPTVPSTGIGGVLATVAEISEQVYAERQLRTLRELAARSAVAEKTAEEACAAAAAAFAENPSDVPFTLFYLCEEGGRSARLVAQSGIDPDAVPAEIELASADGPWQVARAARRRRTEIIGDLLAWSSVLPPSPWAEKPRSAVALPLASPDQPHAYGVVVCGVSPHRVLDEGYRTFYELAAGQVVSSIRNAGAYAAARERAEELAELDRAKTAFFSNISHEFRTPLTLMLGPLQEARAAPAHALAGEDLEIAHRNAVRLLKLVNSLLEFSRIEAGRTQASYAPTDLAALTTDLSSSFRSAIEKAGLELRVDCPPLAEPVWVDRAMWEKIVLNLLSNAFKFTFEGHIDVTLRPAGDTIELVVRDTGVGIPAAHVPELFQRFHRVPGTRSRSHEGTGIGLALVQELARLHGGGIRVESDEGRGTAFTVTIHAGTAHLPAEAIAASTEHTPSPAEANAFVDAALHWIPEAGGPTAASQPGIGTRARILLADDNADMRQYLCRLLSKRYDVEAVVDGEAALAAARARRPDLILSDVMMPRLDGLSLARIRRGDPALRDVPLILLSARAGEAARIEGLEAGVDDYLEKPFGAGELLERVAARLEIARMRRDTATSLRESEEHLRAIVETTPECVKLVDRKGTLLQMNPSGLAMIGAPNAATIVGRCVYDLIAPENRDAFRAFNERICGGEKGVLEFDIIGLTGVRRRMETHAAPLRMPDGEVVHLALSRDVTARRDAEDALRESDRRKDEFIATLSHELRNPLAPLRNALSLLQMMSDGGEKRRSLHEMMERQLNHMVRLVDDLLDMSRINRGSMNLRRERVELAAVVRHAVETSDPLIRRAGHRLEVALPERPLWLRGDLIRLAQIFANLLNNAARFTDPGGRITVRAEVRGGHVLVSVEDTGRGFSPEMAGRLFDMFVKTETSGGLGIGLALALRLAVLHGGDIEAYSQGQGRGARFTVKLPLVPARELVTPAAEIKAEAVAPTACRVLVADDNEDAAESLAALLRATGNDVSLAFDGQQAVEAARGFHPDVALLDIGMPKLNGYQAARSIRRESGPRPITIVALTGWGQEEDRRLAQEAGFDAHLVKPVDFGALRALLASRVH